MAEEPWRPLRQKPETIVQVRVAFDEVGLRGKIKEAGGRWNKNSRVWELPFKAVVSLGLTKRDVEEE